MTRGFLALLLSFFLVSNADAMMGNAPALLAHPDYDNDYVVPLQVQEGYYLTKDGYAVIRTPEGNWAYLNVVPVCVFGGGLSVVQFPVSFVEQANPEVFAPSGNGHMGMEPSHYTYELP
ncbi:hypothetical protein Dpep_2415 [Dethiosulfovibrio peptidovorans DSM 11002]|uniref:Uncharacterized protein n=1 Tax=Dethiosulfovibrio peptidovorans DSM 11002 TaxID=469381 RepID=D2Z4U3_9BACT|nr:hypothetical protein [Dethiosulfovibrio peptidovorans]EFC92437.1 hypothetical protein Dpep_2415 [Dethiosulfovibrio peptidovorans DSM 11002]